MIPVVAPGGDSYLVPKERLGELGEGWRLDTPEEAAARQRAKDFSGTSAAVAAGSAGLLRGVSLGLSDAALTKIGADPAVLRGLKEEQAAASTAGVIAGNLLPLLVPGGAALSVTKGALAVGAPVRGVAALAKGVGGLAGAVTKAGLGARSTGMLGKAAIGAAELGTAGALEAAAFSAGELISEKALGDTELAGDYMIATVGLGTILGWAAGVGVSVLGVMAREASGTAASKIRGLLKKADAVPVEKEIGRIKFETSTALAEAKPGVASELFATAGAYDPKAAALFMDPGKAGQAARRAAALGASTEYRTQAVRGVAQKLDELGAVFDDFAEETMGEMKVEHVAELLSGRPAAGAALDRGPNLARRLRAEIEELVADRDFHGNIVGRNAKAASAYLDHVIKRIDKAAGAGAEPQVFKLLDDTKRAMGKWARPGQNMTSVEQAGTQKIRDLYHEIRDHLENAELYGRAAEAQRAINKEWTALLNTESQFDKAFTTRWGSTEFRPNYRADPAKIETYFRNLGQPAGDLPTEALGNHLRGQIALADAVATSYKLPPAKAAQLARMQETARSLLEDLAEASSNVKAANILRDLSGTASAGQKLGGGVPAKIAATLQLGEGLITRASRIKWIADSAQKIETQISTGITKAIDGMAATGRAAVRAKPAATGALVRLSDIHYGDAPRRLARSEDEAAKEHGAELARLSQQPELLLERLTAQLGDLSADAPQTAAAMNAATIRAVQFLSSRAPKAPKHRGLFDPDWTPSKTDTARFTAYVTAIERPLSILDDLRAGRLAPESVEAVRAVYPQLYRRIAYEVLAKAEAAKDKIKHADRVQLSTLFGAPVDETMTRGAASAIRETWRTITTAPAQGGGGSPRIQNISAPQAAKTRSQVLTGG